MNNMKKRLSALAILASILLIGCAADKGDAKTDETVGAYTDSAVATEALTPEESVLKHLPEASYFNGENFNIGWSQQYDFNEVYFTLEEAEGEAPAEGNAPADAAAFAEEFKAYVLKVADRFGLSLDVYETHERLVEVLDSNKYYQIYLKESLENLFGMVDVTAKLSTLVGDLYDTGVYSFTVGDNVEALELQAHFDALVEKLLASDKAAKLNKLFAAFGMPSVEQLVSGLEKKFAGIYGATVDVEVTVNLIVFDVYTVTFVDPEGIQIIILIEGAKMPRATLTFLIRPRSMSSVASKSAITPSFKGRMVRMLGFTFSCIMRALLPIAMRLPVLMFTATIEGSSTTTLPLCIMSVLAVPRSIANSCVSEKSPISNRFIIFLLNTTPPAKITDQVGAFRQKVSTLNPMAACRNRLSQSGLRLFIE